MLSLISTRNTSKNNVIPTTLLRIKKNTHTVCFLNEDFTFFGIRNSTNALPVFEKIKLNRVLCLNASLFIKPCEHLNPS